MSNVSHVSSVDRGLKMKIKRTKVGPNSTRNDAKHDQLPVKGDPASGSTGTQHSSPGGVHLVNGVPLGSNNTTAGVTMDTKPSGSVGGSSSNTNSSGSSASSSSTPTKVGSSSGLAPPVDLSKDKSSPKVKAPVFAKRDKSKDKSVSGLMKPQQGETISLLPNGSSSGSSSGGSGGGGGGGGSGVSSGGGAGGGGGGGLTIAGSGGGGGGGLSGVGNGLVDHYPQITMEPRVAVEAVSVKRDILRPVLDDPYEFNAKVEDGFGLPPKKLKTETKVSKEKKKKNKKKTTMQHTLT